MELSILLSKQIIIIGIMIIIGIIAGKANLIDDKTSIELSKVTLYVICPCTFINAFQQELTMNKLKGFMISLAGAIIFHLGMIIVFKLISKRKKINLASQASIIYTNCGNLLLPIIGYVLEPEYVFYCSPYIVVQLVLFWTHGYTLLSGERKIDIKKIIKNPNILATIVGMTLFFGNITLPTYLGSAMSRIADCVGPISMLVVGIIISKANLKEVFLDKKTWIATFVRLIICPFLYILFLSLIHASSFLPDAKSILYVSFLAAAAPSASSVGQLANLLHRDEVIASSINIMTTIFCMITMPLMTILYQLLV